jgi:FAD/FMN-containing dehydrogenase
MVRPDGSLLEVSEDSDPALMRQVRCSYGMFGIVYEVSYRIRALTPMAVHHKTFELEEFIDALPDLKALNYSIMYYLFPFDNKITVEFRKYNPDATGEPNRTAWALRNHIWGTAGPKLGHDLEQTVDNRAVRYGIIDKFNAAWRFQLENLVVGDNTVPSDQIIDYPAVSDDSRYTFSFFAFDEFSFPKVLAEFVKFAKDYYQQNGYRSNLLYVGYRILQDQNAMLSYSWDGNVMTIDPVSTGNTGWKDFLAAYNQFCSDRNGRPILNQTFGLTSAIVHKAFADRWDTIGSTRQTFDPGGRLLNDYFRGLLTQT